MMQPTVVSIQADKIREARKAKHFSQGQLARSVGLSRVTINQIENGRRKSIKPHTLHKLAEALEKPEIYFYSEAIPSPDTLPNPLKEVMTRLLVLPHSEQKKLGYIFEQIVDLYEAK